MMKRVIIICEGETEVAFCKKILADYFLTKNMYLSAIDLEGIQSWGKIKKMIQNLLKQDTTVFISTLFDFYGIKESHQFPKWKESYSISDKHQKMDFLEQAMKDELLDNRFLPYLQLHEFEALCFSDKTVFYEQIPSNELNNEELECIFEQYSNPEMINDNKETSPSHRLEKIIKGYHKIVYGNILLESIGLSKIRTKCTRFNEWVLKIENL